MHELVSAAVAKEESSKWRIISTVFPSLSTYLKLFPVNSKERVQAISSVCKTTQDGEGDADAEDSGALETCWKSHPNGGSGLTAVLDHSSSVLSASVMVPVLGILLLLTSETNYEGCAFLYRDCTNDNMLGSMCFEPCFLAQSDEGEMNFLDHSFAQVLVCNSQGRWDRLFDCIKVPTKQCYSDGVSKMELTSNSKIGQAGALNSLGEAIALCNALSQCVAISFRSDNKYTLHQSADPVADLTVATGSTTWFKQLCAQPYRRFRSYYVDPV
jgi:hypothetical protein